ncbi:MAG: hypothetical protein QF570_11350 [Myxococcota bacterium]|nr:hypothetical protein [Myxococcota bacterium]
MNEAPTLSVRFVNVYLVGYLLDAVLSIFVLGLLPEGGPALLVALQRLLASLVFAMTIVLIPLLALSPKLPLGLLFAIVVSVFWLASGAVPIPLWVAPDEGLPAVLALLQGIFAVAAFARIRVYNVGRGNGWWLRDSTLRDPESKGRRMLRFSAVALGVGVPLALVYLVASLSTWIAVETGHFVSVDLTGIQLADRRYTKGDREIRLVGMMHLGEEEAYREITESFLGRDTVVLEEGVSDEDAVLEEAIRYDTLAGRMGLSAQRSLGSYLAGYYDAESVAVDSPLRPQLRNADVDSRSFAPATRRVLAHAAGVWSADDPFAAFVELYTYLIENPGDADTFFRDVIVMRNEHLMGEMERALGQSRRVIVPWGALHLPGIEAFVLDRGFVQAAEARRRVVSWSTLWAALLES